MSRYIDIEPYEKDGWYLQKHYHNSYGEVIKTTPLVSIPTADVEPVKHGKWIGKPIAGYSTVRCSICRTAYLENAGQWNYCPNCGAKMDLKEDDE